MYTLIIVCLPFILPGNNEKLKKFINNNDEFLFYNSDREKEAINN